MPEVAPALITVTNSQLTVTGAGGELITIVSMYESKDSAIATLTELFGFTPTPIIRTMDFPMDAGYKAVDFEGFMVVDANIPERGWQFAVLVVTPAVRGVQIEAIGGIQVGDPFAEASALHASGLYHEEGSGGGWHTVYYKLPGERYDLNVRGSDTGLVTDIVAPSGA